MSLSARKKRPKGRRVLRLGAVLLVASAVAWFLIERYVIDVDRYREIVVAAIEDSTGLPASVGRLDLDLLPTPRLSAHEVRVGEGNFRARAERITIEAKLLPLLRRRVDITSVRIDALEARIPKNPAKLSRRINEIVETASQPSGGSGAGLRVSIGAIGTTDAALFLGQDDEASATVSFDLLDVLSDAITLSIKVESSRVGEDAALDYELQVARANGKVTSLTGSGKVSGVETKGLGPEGTPEGRFSADLTMDGRGANDIDFELKGTFESEGQAALAGRLVATASWREDGLTVHEAIWTSPGLEARGDAVLGREGTLALRLRSVQADQGALNDLAGLASFAGVLPVANEDGAIRVKDVVMEFPAEGAPRLSTGELTFQGITIEDAQGGTLAEGLEGRIVVDEGLIRIDEFTSDSFSLQGTLRPDFDAPSLTIDLRGRAKIRLAHVAAFLGSDVVRDAEGDLIVAVLTCTIAPGQGIPGDLAIEATLEGGKLDLKTDAYELRIAPVTIEFATDSEGIHTTLRAASPDIGPLIVKGRYAPEEGKWLGRVTADVPLIVAAFLLPESGLPIIDPVLARYGHSTFWAELELPTDENDGVAVYLRREGAPTLEGRLAFVPDASGSMRLGKIEVESRMQLEGLGEEIFSDVAATGEGRITFTRDPAQARFDFQADLTQASIKAGEFIEKKQGDRFGFRILGDAGDTWAAREIRVDLLEETVSVVLAEDGGAKVQFNLEVEQLAGLFPEGSTTHGVISGEFTSAPWEGRLTFDGVGFAIDSERRLRSISGTLEILDDVVAIRELAIVGVRSDFTLAATRQDGRWDGSLRGAALDLDWVRVLANGAASFTSHREEPAPGDSLWDDPLLGEFYVHLDKIYYRRGEMDAMTARVLAGPDAIRIQDLSLRPYSGKLTGTIDIVPGGDTDAVVRAELKLDEIDGRIFDEILYDEPGEVHGTISATVSVSAPLGAPKAMIAAANGRAVWTATEGSLGKLGFATKLLTALKTVEVINLKVPSLRDEGLTYNTFTGEVQINSGVMALKNVLLDGGAYELEADGQVDFAQEEIDVTVHVHVLESVSKIIEKVPVIGEITKLTTDLVGVTVLMKGSPYDLETVVVPGGDSILENTKEIGEKAIEGVTKVIKKLIPGGEKP
ncbi:MAG: AsmA-like C-terminal domain-containing protein [Candidatus Hydrogenedentes bacterium]|nr:AsmA-like C-terminal domain-containing protein [Candidatus Hydrogenedentota bacterium]